MKTFASDLSLVLTKQNAHVTTPRAVLEWETGAKKGTLFYPQGLGGGSSL